MEKNNKQCDEHWEKEVMKLTKKQIIQRLAQRIERCHHLFLIAKKHEECRNYLMANDPKDITREGTLNALGFDNNGLNLIFK